MLSYINQEPLHETCVQNGQKMIKWSHFLIADIFKTPKSLNRKMTKEYISE